MNLDVVTLQDCIENFEMKGYQTVINDGKVLGFTKGIKGQEGVEGFCG